MADIEYKLSIGDVHFVGHLSEKALELTDIELVQEILRRYSYFKTMSAVLSGEEKFKLKISGQED